MKPTTIFSWKKKTRQNKQSNDIKRFAIIDYLYEQTNLNKKVSQNDILVLRAM